MSARARRSHEEEGISERWLLTYSDMITLLLALFIVLFAFSTIDIKKFLELRLGLTAAFNPTAIAVKGGAGLLQATSLASSPGSSASHDPVFVPEQGNSSQGNEQHVQLATPDATQIALEIQRGLRNAGLATYASVSIDARGTVVHILADKVFFQSGSADLGPIGDRIVDVIGTVIRPDPNHLTVEGFTDNVPIHSALFSSNWQLSAMRAANVVERLNAVDHVRSARLDSAGYGAAEPVASNATPRGRALNRRVDVVILNNTGLPTEATSGN